MPAQMIRLEAFILPLLFAVSNCLQLLAPTVIKRNGPMSACFASKPFAVQLRRPTRSLLGLALTGSVGSLPGDFNNTALINAQVSINKQMMNAQTRQDVLEAIRGGDESLGLKKLSCINLVTAFNRLAKARPSREREKNGDIIVGALIQETARRLSEQGSTFEERQLSSLVWALSKLNLLVDNTRAVLAKEILRRGFTAFSAQGLANTAWGFSHSIGASSKAIVLSISEELQTRDMQRLLPQDLGNIAWAIGRIAGGRSTRRTTEFQAPQTPLEPLTGAEAERSLATLARIGRAVLAGDAAMLASTNPQEIANIVWAFGRCAPSSAAAELLPTEDDGRGLMLEEEEEEDVESGGAESKVLEELCSSAAERGLVERMKSQEIASTVRPPPLFLVASLHSWPSDRLFTAH
eukprot:1296928-Rhodomonas_salina.1